MIQLYKKEVQYAICFKKHKKLFEMGLIILFSVLFIISLAIPINNNAMAMSYDNNQINSDTSASTFGNAVQPRWYTLAYRLAYANNDDYSSHTYVAKYPNYYSPAGGITATAIPLNDEMYALEAVDSVGNHRLEPVTSIAAANNITGQSYVNVTFTHFRGIPEVYNCSMRDDTRKMKDLYNDLRIPNDKTEVKYGKIMYRTAPYGAQTFGSWSYENLSAGMLLHFGGGQHVQIVVIYEIREEAPNIFKKIIYHHIVGIYRFNVD